MFNYFFYKLNDIKLRKFCIKCASGSRNPAEQTIYLYRFATGKLEPLKNMTKYAESQKHSPNFVKWDDTASNFDVDSLIAKLKSEQRPTLTGKHFTEAVFNQLVQYVADDDEYIKLLKSRIRRINQ
jgi:hypothetical protein